MVHEAAIRTELEGLRARLPEVTGAIAATTDGLLLAADAPGVQAEGFAALTAAALGVGLRLADSAGQQSMRELLVRCDSGCVVLHAAGRDAVLAVLAGPRANVGRLHLEARRSGARLAELLGAAPAAPEGGGAR
ncbi:roadblock/LC7 domain-containing protein [Streptomyces cocklensis]|jgi:predicted regulator of Ras-like GTPase activity (Roadblock/LC7/MglB family)|uniref:Robl_LC7 domain-containing protein n=1 Tax=Actinacidiphila cocklensis TaxID=887465 RepID=A0A9W4DKC7_9ACTN|nr:roadblock/LC7 domain-containing protein [Actinacidiphila cocklensis]MDD1061918.1 roadblock/LC7 domain-containing protein [Actinacidiphila cocklensis]CAG6391293.1 Robl_LC7 domain-containing protein [Actinacidiphila cocklensis]